MRKICRSVVVTLVMSVLLLGLSGLSGCKQEGPMERAGKKVDKTVEKGGEQLDKAGKSIKDTVKEK